MSFVQKDRNSRKDKLEAGVTGSGPEKPKVVVRVGEKGERSVHLHIPDSAAPKEDHLKALLERLEAREED